MLTLLGPFVFLYMQILSLFARSSNHSVCSLFPSLPPSLPKQDCTYSHFEHSSSCPTCRKQLGENDFTELVVADNYEALTNENAWLKQHNSSLRIQYEQNLNDMQNKLMAKERTLTEQNHVIINFRMLMVHVSVVKVVVHVRQQTWQVGTRNHPFVGSWMRTRRWV